MNAIRAVDLDVSSESFFILIAMKIAQLTHMNA